MRAEVQFVTLQLGEIGIKSFIITEREETFTVVKKGCIFSPNLKKIPF